ncbi:MAG: hypothetical protein DMG07_04885 [Acidobacteria bacterium]|nr:MAG: hypothetical protein DMG07_04885 [Acidobacteriota bacterium]
MLGGLVFEQLETLKEACLPGPDDPELLAGCRSRGLPAFERLYRDHGPRMMSIALNLLGNVADAEDVVQDAFLKIFRGGGGFRGRSALSTWIYRILVNSCYDLMRRKKRRREEPELEPEGGERPQASAGAPDHPLRLALEKSLARLDPRRRSIFLLFEVEGFKHREIAEILNIPEGTSKNLLFEAKRELHRLLSEDRGGSKSRWHEDRV